MGIATFEKGTVLFINDRPHVLKRMIDENVWQTEEEKTGRIKEYKLDQLHRLYLKGDLVFANDSKSDSLASLHIKDGKRSAVLNLVNSKEEWERVKIIRQYVMAVFDLPTSKIVMAPEIKKVWEGLGAKGKVPSWISVSRWKRKYIISGKDINSFLPPNHAKGNRTRRYPTEVLNLVDEAVDKVFMTRERKTFEDTFNHALNLVKQENKLRHAEMQLPLPTIRLVKSAVNNIPMFDRHAARYGRMAANKMFRGVLKQLVLKRVLELAEIDHTKFDLFVVDDETGVPWGRPWITICIDKFSRCILGIYMGVEPPSYLTVARCLKHAFLPKVDLRNMHPEIDNEWYAHGVMDKLVVDNGLEFHSDSLEALCFTLGIDLQYTPRKTPWWKGTVERFIGTMNRGVAHGNPGTSFSNIFEKDDYDPAKHAIITFKTLKLALNKWVSDVYHHRPHRSLDGICPAVMWSSNIKVEEIRVPEDPSRLDAIMGTIERRVLTHKGIEFEGLRYNSPELIALRRRLSDKLNVELRVDEGDLGHIFVIAPDMSQFFKVPCLNQEYAARLTLWQHNVCKRYVKLHMNKSDSPESWRQAKEEVAEIIRRDVLKKRGKAKNSSSKSARFTNVGQSISQTIDPDIPPAGSVLTENPQPLQPVTPSQVLIVPVTSTPSLRPKFVPIIQDRSSN